MSDIINQRHSPREIARRNLLAQFAGVEISAAVIEALENQKFSESEALVARAVFQIETLARPMEVQTLEFLLASFACIAGLIQRSHLRNYTVGSFQIGIVTSLLWTRTPLTVYSYFQRMLVLGTTLGSIRIFRIGLYRSHARHRGAIDVKKFSDFYNGIGNFIPHSLKYPEVLAFLIEANRCPRKLERDLVLRIDERIDSRLARIRGVVRDGDELCAVLMLASVRERGITYSRFYGRPARRVPVIEMARPVGSTLKIALYSAALERGAIEAHSEIDDEPINITWRDQVISPRNADRKFRGKVSLTYAFANSINVPAIKIVQLLGIENFVGYLRQCRLRCSLPNSPLIALGAVPMVGRELLAVMVPILNEGYAFPLKSAGKINEFDFLDKDRILSSKTCLEMKRLLRASVENGTASFLKSINNSTLGGKTGTSEGNRDLWFVGALSDDLFGLVWLGFCDEREIVALDQKEASSSRFAVPLWAEVARSLSDALADRFDDGSSH